MPSALLDDELWRLVEPLLPVRRRRFCQPGRKRLDDRCTLSGILFVLRTGIAWQQLPQELGYGSGMTCWRPSPNCCRSLEAIPAIQGVAGRPRRRPTVLLAGRGYDSQAHRQALRTLGVRR